MQECDSAKNTRSVNVTKLLAPVCAAYLDWAASCYVDPPAVIAATAWKFEGMEALAIQHCQKYGAIFRYCLEDEMPHDHPLRTVRKFRIDLAQSPSLQRVM
jgi:hypothetical protein